MRWSHTVTNGTLTMLCVSPDGTVAARHYNSVFDRTVLQRTIKFDHIIVINGDGSVRWDISNPLPGSSLTNGRWGSNGTFLVNANAGNTTYEIGINETGSGAYVREVHYYTGGHHYKKGLDGTIEYRFWVEPIDLDYQEVCVVAFNTTTGEELWRTRLHTTTTPVIILQVLPHGNGPSSAEEGSTATAWMATPTA